MRRIFCRVPAGASGGRKQSRNMDDQHKENETTQNLTSLIRELEDRRTRWVHSRMRMFLWDATVRLSYALKRFFDVVLSILALIVLSPLFIVIAVLVKLTSRGPIFFVQERVGYYGRSFMFFKFRSMYVDAEARKRALMKLNESGDGVIFKMKNDPRITPIGRFLRKSSMDELPQLLNVLLGDMSLVGPRPPLPSEVQQYTLEDRKRLNVKPGITCIWQVSGRSDIPFRQQVELDKEYIQSQSLWKDLLVLLRTVPAILSGRGAY